VAGIPASTTQPHKTIETCLKPLSHCFKQAHRRRGSGIQRFNLTRHGNNEMLLRRIQQRF